MLNVIKILVVDDHPTVRLGIEKLLENKEDIVLTGGAGIANEAIEMIEKTEPHVVLVDLSLNNDMSGIDFIRAVSKRYPSIKLLVHSMFDEAVYAERVLRAGAKGYIQKNEAPHRIIDGIRSVVKGDLVLSDRIKDKIIYKLMHGGSTENSSDTDGMGMLSNREFEIFQLFGRGHNIKEISQILNLSSNTVETHRRNIREKLNLLSNNQLIRSAVEWVTQNKK